MILFLIIIAFLLGSAYFNKDVTLRDYAKFLISSSLSFIVLLLFLLLLTSLGQGITIVISLFFDTVNMFLTILLVNFLALILSHYPYYFEAAISDKGRKLVWKKYPENRFLGVVYHTNKLPDEHQSPEYIKFIRCHIGILTFFIWIYTLFVVDFSVFESKVSIYVPGFLVWLILFYIHSILEKKQDQVEAIIGDEQSEEYDIEKSKKRIKRYLKTYQILLIVNILLSIVFLIIIANTGWCRLNLYFLIGLSFLHAICYIYFRVFRSWFVYLNPNPNKINKDSKFARVIDAFFTRKESLKGFKVGFIKPLYYLANHIWYLGLMTVFGIFLAAILLFSNIYTDLSLGIINPIPLLMILVIIYYSAVVVTMKHYIYHNYRYKNKKEDALNHHSDHEIVMDILSKDSDFRIHRLCAKLISIVPLLIVLFFVATSYVNNSLHELSLVKESKNNVKIDKHDFFTSLDLENDNFFIVGSYGGGLKANVWNLLLLNKLRTDNPEFFNSTLCMSGVSGGAIGLANFFAARYNHGIGNDSKWDTIINKIGGSNTLSIDINGLLLTDLYREVIPGRMLSDLGKDRSWHSMIYFAKIIEGKIPVGDTALVLKTPMNEYWSKLHSDSGYFPALIFNTTPTQSKYGVACSVEGFNQFPISIDILDHENKTLSFFDAASTTNRFPLFSPAARVPNKRHFVDGGYFENSGLMNALSFYEELAEEYDTLMSKSIYAINIINDKTNYILEKMDGKITSNYENSSSAEFASILNGIVALERMPNYWREHIRDKMNPVQLRTIQMPYFITLDDVKSVYNTDKIINESEIIELIQENNDSIQNALERYYPYLDKWGRVMPPLGRVLSEPAREYQKAMVEEHYKIKEQLNEIKGLCN